MIDVDDVRSPRLRRIIGQRFQRPCWIIFRPVSRHRHELVGIVQTESEARRLLAKGGYGRLHTRWWISKAPKREAA